MKKQTKIFLFGAGAIIDWNGPTTPELTKLVRESGFTIKNSTTRITEFIYSRLIKNGFTEEEVNFETIINVIEELSIYYSEHNKNTHTPSILRTFLKDDDLDSILNYTIEGSQRKHGYRLQIPAGSEYNFAKRAYHGENPNQFFLQHLLALLITIINVRISKYAYHTHSHSVVDKQMDNSLLFKNWIQSIEKKSLLRMYTLNYDRIFKVLLYDIEIDCFEGYNVTETISDMKGLRANVPRILNDFNCNVHYNLHGSAFWKVLPLDNGQLPNPEVVFTGSPQLPSNDEQASVQIEKGKPVYLTNIITGYQKAQKAMITPFKQMHSAFDRDCCNAMKIYIIGYSFGDEHINECIKTALRHNENLSLEIIDPRFISNKLDEKLNLTIFQFIDNEHLNPKKIEDNKFSYFKERVIVYTLKFKDYLEQKKAAANN
ncbi:MAG: hypothetical protein APF83_03235 [Lutibacter sp. BRH_c52]|nr:MAG: hypothetical protein APF83_03235 [Lutibacter sp. BRH_c52]